MFLVWPSPNRPLTPIWRDETVVQAFQLNLPHIFIVWMGIAENVFKVRGQRSRSHDSNKW